VGFAGLVQSASWGDCGYLCRAGVVSSARGLGIQNRLIAVRVRKAKQVGYNWLVSDTRDNPASSNSLINNGFKLFDPSNPWGYSDALYWRKKLTDAVQRPRSKKKKASGIRKKALPKK
jgi:GNAT superfamily N-acetyltransferase